MTDFSFLIGGQAGEGINQAGLFVARILSRLGYRVYVYYDYPSLIRGGHNFSIIRVSGDKVACHRETIDVLLALNQDALDLHNDRLKQQALIIYDSDTVNFSELATQAGMGVPLGKIIKEENAPAIMRNSCIVGAFCKAVGIGENVLEEVLKEQGTKETELNLKVAFRGYDLAREHLKIRPVSQTALPLVAGNEAISLGLVKAGLKAYLAYPMTPASGILHILAQMAREFSLKVIHPENEIAVMLMALGFAYAGEKTAVGTSGGGFCLMNEGLSLAGMAELPVVLIVSQRPGPSTGMPTYTAQTELQFVLYAGQGEFPRFIIAPGDAEEAYYWSGVALNMAWKWQLPAIILSDKTLSEGSFSFDLDSLKTLEPEQPLRPDKQQAAVPPFSYKRYLNTATGVSPLSVVPEAGEVIKANSYAHDEFGITTEDSQEIKQSQDKLQRKEIFMAEDLENYEQVKVYGNKDAGVAVLCWGSNKGVCLEAAGRLGLKIIQPLVLRPFPLKQFWRAVEGVKKIICVESNATAQLARIISCYGIKVDEKILKYDGRPFLLEELEERLKAVTDNRKV